jgi:hypothetical protein
MLSIRWYDDGWGKRWGAQEQYKMDGTPAGMGNASTLEYEAGLYLFKYNPETHVLEAVRLEAGVIDTYVTPRLYGAFNVWDLDGPNAKVFTKTGDTTFELEITFDEAGSSDFTVCLSRKWYDDEWGKRWGAETQFKFDGTPAGFGQATEINYETGTYKFIYNSETHETTYQKIA